MIRLLFLWCLSVPGFAQRQGEFSNFVDLPSQELRNIGQNGQNQANQGECALELDHGGCITYRDVDLAFSLAERNLDYFELRYRPRENLTNEEMGNLGTVIHETTRILAKVISTQALIATLRVCLQEYRLDPRLLNEGLSQIDTTKTIIRDYCPEYLLPRHCETERYRNLEGTCNNLKNPLWGAAMKAHSRFLPYDFEDGISAPRISITGRELPSARLVIILARANFI